MKYFQEYIFEVASVSNVIDHPDLDYNPEMKKKAMEIIRQRRLRVPKDSSIVKSEPSTITKAPSSAITPYQAPQSQKTINNIKLEPPSNQGIEGKATLEVMNKKRGGKSLVSRIKKRYKANAWKTNDKVDITREAPHHTPTRTETPINRIAV